jgi:hypothetical protein
MGHAKVASTYDLYGHLMPGNEAEAASLLDAYVKRAGWRVIVAPMVARPQDFAL